MSTLHDMTSEYSRLFDLASDQDADADSFGAAIESLADSIREKAVAVAAVICNLEHLSDGIGERIKGLQKRAETIDARAQWLRRYLLDCMEIAGEAKIETAEAKIAIATNPPKLVIADHAAIPSRYIVEKTVQSIDRNSLKRDVMGGEEIDGVRVVRDKRVVIG